MKIPDKVIESMPKHVRECLGQTSKTSSKYAAIIEKIKTYGNQSNLFSIDQFKAAYWEVTQEVPASTKIFNLLNTMIRKGVLERVNMQGVYLIADKDNKHELASLFMGIFERPDFHQIISPVQAHQVFSKVLHGSSDISIDLLEDLGSEYDVDILKIMKGYE